MSAPLIWFDVSVPLVRVNPDGTRDTQDIKLRIPSRDLEWAEDAAKEIAWAIVENLPKTEDNNRYGWKIAGFGVEVSEAKP